MMGKWDNSAFACGNPIKHHGCPCIGTIFWSISYQLFPVERMDILSAPSPDRGLKASRLRTSCGMRYAVIEFSIVGQENRIFSVGPLFQHGAIIHFVRHGYRHIAGAEVRSVRQWFSWTNAQCSRHRSRQRAGDQTNYIGYRSTDRNGRSQFRDHRVAPYQRSQLQNHSRVGRQSRCRSILRAPPDRIAVIT